MTDEAINAGAGAVARARRSRATGQLTLGVVLLVVGIVITAVTYGSASNGGGSYVIAYGPIIVGVIKIVRGLMYLNG
jgi:hypothetical protein